MQHLQTSFFYDLQELIRNAALLRKYYYIFNALNLSELPDRNHGPGRTSHSKHAMLRAFIVKHLEAIKFVPQLIEYLNSNPPLLEMCGFELGNLSDETQFYRFLKKTKNSTLKDIHKAANDLLIKDGSISLDEFILDSKPVMAATKENNFKNPNKDRQIIEQYFSRLGDREVEQTTHYSFTAISDQMTIAHLGASLVAVAAAVILKQADKIRCYRTFANPPNLGQAG